MVIRPIAFRPSPARPGSSTGPPVGSGSRPPSSTFTSPGRGPGSSAPSPGLSTGYRTPVQTTFGPGGSVVTGPGSGQAPPTQGFLPGHPLVKDGHRPFGSEYPKYYPLKLLDSELLNCSLPTNILSPPVYGCVGVITCPCQPPPGPPTRPLISAEFIQLDVVAGTNQGFNG